MIYGALPLDLGLVDIRPTEMMFWMYCPIATPREMMTVPANLRQFMPILHAIEAHDHDAFAGRYVYLTAKTLWVSGDYIGNRPGWHSDGFGTSDISYVWADRAPTEFLADEFTLPAKCADAMERMEFRAKLIGDIRTYPDRHLLRLDQRVIHRSPVGFAAGMRTFAKVSISTDRYDLEGNSVNHGLRETWPLRPRQTERNHPQQVPLPIEHLNAAETGAG